MTYLILRFSSLGNVAMMVPLIASLSENYPDDKFIIVCQKRLEDMFFGMKNVSVLAFDGLKAAGDNTRLYQQINKRFKIDVVIDLQDIFHTHLLRFLYRLRGKKVVSVIPNRISKWFCCHLHRIGKASSFRQSQIWFAPIKQEVERYRQAFERAGLKTDSSFEALKTNDSAAAAVEQRWSKRQDQRWIGIAPFAKHKTNMLPYQVMKDVIERLTREGKTHIFLFGAGAIECEMLRQWASIFPNTESVAGVLPLSEELELMRRLDVMLCMDSANQHLASLVGLRAISIWCGTHPKLGFSAWKQNAADIIGKQVSCRPCTVHGKEYCKFRNYLCKQITAKEITDRI